MASGATSPAQTPYANRNRPLATALACLCLCVAGAALTSCEPPPQPPNVLLITVDTLRADAIGAYGRSQARSPNIDQLAREGTLFAQATTPMPRTTPGVGSLLTGLWPQGHGSREVGDPLAPVPTLAEILAEQGYATLGLSTNDAAGPRQGIDRGFERFVDYHQLHQIYGDRLYDSLDDNPPEPVGWATATTEQALNLLAEVPADRPFFLWTLYFDPHFAYRPPPPWRDLVQAQRCWGLYELYQQRRLRGGLLFADVGGLASGVVEDCRRLYAAEVAYVDHEIGRLLEALRRRGQLDNTVVIVTADHGENLGEGGLYFEHGDNAHGAGLRVPLIWQGPGVAAGHRDEGVVSLVDIVPTLLALLGLEVESATDGLDLSPRLAAAGPAAPPRRSRVVFGESASALWNESYDLLLTGRRGGRVCINDPPLSLCQDQAQSLDSWQLYDHVADPFLTRDLATEQPQDVGRLLEAWQRWPAESARQRVARGDRFKLVETPRLEGGYSRQLFDILADPAESHDVASDHPEVVAQLGRQLDAWTATLPKVLERKIDPEIEASLRALGYMN